MKIGFLINPVAGMGGKVALKGTDGEETLRRALELGAVPMAGTRAAEAVKEFAENAGDCRFYSPSGGMGADLLKSYGLETELLFDPSTHTTPADTKRAAEMMLERGVGLVVFAGRAIFAPSSASASPSSASPPESRYIPASTPRGRKTRGCSSITSCLEKSSASRLRRSSTLTKRPSVTILCARASTAT